MVNGEMFTSMSESLRVSERQRNEKEKTETEKKREKEYEKVKGNVNFIVKNIIPTGEVITKFDDLEETLHKLKLDLMTMAKHIGEIKTEVLAEEVI